MGLPRMENLHAPTVPSGPVSARPSSNDQNKGLSFAQLQANKDNIEAEIKALSSVLDSVGAKQAVVGSSVNTSKSMALT